MKMSQIFLKSVSPQAKIKILLVEGKLFNSKKNRSYFHDFWPVFILLGSESVTQIPGFAVML